VGFLKFVISKLRSYATLLLPLFNTSLYKEDVSST